MQRSERLKTIIRAIDGGSRRTADLAELTGASMITIRRDLAELEERGALERTRGGARAAPARGAEFPFALRESEEFAKKVALAHAGRNVVRSGQSVLVDNGTTALAIARELAGARVTALALSLHAAAALASRPGNEVIVPGGTIDHDGLSFTGIGAVETIRAMRFDVAFIGACSADPTHGLTVASWPDAQIKRAAMESSARKVLLATATKFSRTSAHRFGSYEDLDMIITTADAPSAALYAAREAGVEVVTVPLSEISDQEGSDGQRSPLT